MITVRTRRLTSAVWAVAVASALSILPQTEASAAAGVPGMLREGGEVEPPRAFTDLCRRRPEICPDRSMAQELSALRRSLASMYGAAALTPARLQLDEMRSRQLAMVNLSVNATIQPVEDRGPDVWSLTHVGGDCEEYVLAKMNLLASLGWPRAAMRITVVRDGQGYHAVLVVETDRGAFVLDNMTNEITTVATSPYQFVVAESVLRPGSWVRVTR